MVRSDGSSCSVQQERRLLCFVRPGLPARYDFGSKPSEVLKPSGSFRKSYDSMTSEVWITLVF